MTTVFGQLFVSVSEDLNVWIGLVYGFVIFLQINGIIRAVIIVN